ncbi:bifunctional adenosylcobinamide kinase/adenosylcobinamide-phosphate guanylyltransferase [Paenibacillus radicis (ex Gao et al. 2016)]|uniref:Adenosylcobinamide kinase n=1 Tax=Paenibacillus radicis (ex Gao et al. 2016) TaxID=1737354 RepID=A0A917HIR4_9BACL|nr:bifunctional adenosylcobinamide kinase/adenosylcobinamide-phosphate guanylyltransferase [Paenibacillus radicis (ex Gao et al. 2016)]GGG79963.1 adenosylcobinamide kinase/adenosylcobinamide phosphate guanyltransferase [Paenibacillus radicis (ex Gao et al. 2016)]
MAILVTGGARSGKSSFAEQLAARLGRRGIYIATSRVWDEEMAERIERHKRDRNSTGFEWQTIEEPLELAQTLQQLTRAAESASLSLDEAERPVVLVDCLTLWISNWLLLAEEKQTELPDLKMGEWLEPQTQLLLDAIAAFPYPLVLVTNEVGDGVVPPYPLGRIFRDEAGRLNQRIAAISERVFLVTAGIPVDVKSLAFRWEQL